MPMTQAEYLKARNRLGSVRDRIGVSGARTSAQTADLVRKARLGGLGGASVDLGGGPARGESGGGRSIWDYIPGMGGNKDRGPNYMERPAGATTAYGNGTTDTTTTTTTTGGGGGGGESSGGEPSGGVLDYVTEHPVKTGGVIVGVGVGLKLARIGVRALFGV